MSPTLRSMLKTVKHHAARVVWHSCRCQPQTIATSNTSRLHHSDLGSSIDPMRTVHHLAKPTLQHKPTAVSPPTPNSESASDRKNCWASLHTSCWWKTYNVVQRVSSGTEALISRRVAPSTPWQQRTVCLHACCANIASQMAWLSRPEVANVTLVGPRWLSRLKP